MRAPGPRRAAARAHVAVSSPVATSPRRARTARAKRYEQALGGFISDRGGHDRISHAEYALCCEAAGVQTLCRESFTDFLAGVKFDAELYLQAVGTLNRLASKLGLRRAVPEEVRWHCAPVQRPHRTELKGDRPSDSGDFRAEYQHREHRLWSDQNGNAAQWRSRNQVVG